MICAKAKTAVSGLEKEFPGQVKAENLDATTEAARKAIKALGFDSHGLVVRAPNGKMLFKQADHSVDMDAVRRELHRLLEKPK